MFWAGASFNVAWRAPVSIRRIWSLAMRLWLAFVIPTEKPAVIHEDPDDDEVLACALSARVEVIVSGDRHLRGLGSFRGIRIVTAAELLA